MTLPQLSTRLDKVQNGVKMLRRCLKAAAPFEFLWCNPDIDVCSVLAPSKLERLNLLKIKLTKDLIRLLESERNQLLSQIRKELRSLK